VVPCDGRFCQRGRMDWREFATELTGQLLTWPIIVLVIVVIFRNQLRDLLKRLKSLQIAGYTAEFWPSLRAAQDYAVSARTTRFGIYSGYAWDEGTPSDRINEV